MTLTCRMAAPAHETRRWRSNSAGMNNPNLRLYAVSQPRNLTYTLTDFQWMRLTNLLACMLGWSWQK